MGSGTATPFDSTNPEPERPGSSEYYPPRSRRSRVGRRWVQRRVRPANLPRPAGIVNGLLAFVLPGYAYLLLGRRATFLVVLAAWLIGFTFMLGLLGHWSANLVFGLMAGVHSASLVHWIHRRVHLDGLLTRMLLSGSLLVAVWAGLYLPIRALPLRELALPIRINGRVIVVNPRLAPQDVQRHDLLVYRINAAYGNSVGIHPGTGMGRVLALPGEVVQFTPEGCVIGQRRHPSLPHMPDRGELAVPQRCWFIWPHPATISITGAHADLAETMRSIALVPENRLLGRPYDSWFGRRQKTI